MLSLVRAVCTAHDCRQALMNETLTNYDCNQVLAFVSCILSRGRAAARQRQAVAESCLFSLASARAHTHAIRLTLKHDSLGDDNRYQVIAFVMLWIVLLF